MARNPWAAPQNPKRSSSEMFSLSKENSVNLFTVLVSPLALAVVVWALLGISPGDISPGVITISLLTIFCSCYLRIQLPRVSIHFTISDGFIILALLLYGGQI